MLKTKDGRPAHLGSMYFETDECNNTRRKYCVGYCPNCKTKIGVTTEDIELFSSNIPGFVIRGLRSFLKIRIKIIFPK